MGRRLRSRGTKSMPVLSKGCELVASLFLLRFICCALYKANVHSDLKFDVTWSPYLILCNCLSQHTLVRVKDRQMQMNSKASLGVFSFLSFYALLFCTLLLN